jgi:phage baseplate assembly protein gpV
MNRELANFIHHEIERHLAQNRDNKRMGLVTSYDPKTHMAKVMLGPSGHETPWLPIARQHMGNGWGIVIGLTPGDGISTGDQVEVTYHGGDLDSGRITGMYHSDQDQPPQVQSGEILLQHQSGSKVYLDQNGNVIHVSQQAYNVTGQNGVTITAQGASGGNLA